VLLPNVQKRPASDGGKEQQFVRFGNCKKWQDGAKWTIQEIIMAASSNFASVKLPIDLVEQAREAAQPLRRSAAGQIEYWATLGRVVEHSGLTAQEAQAAIEGYEAAARKARPKAAHAATGKTPKAPDTLAALTDRVMEISTNGTLHAHVRRIVEENRQLAAQRAAA
jgi:hypothetical protein